MGVGVQILGKEILPFCLLIMKTRKISRTLLEVFLRHTINLKRQVAEVRQEEGEGFKVEAVTALVEQPVSLISMLDQGILP